MELDIYNSLYYDYADCSRYSEATASGYYTKLWAKNPNDVTIINGYFLGEDLPGVKQYIKQLKKVKRYIIQATPFPVRLKKKPYKTVDLFGAPMTKISKNYYCMIYGNIYTIGDNKVVSVANDDKAYDMLRELLPILKKEDREKVYILIRYGDGKLYEKLERNYFPLFDRIVFGDKCWKEPSEFNKKFITASVSKGKPVVFGKYERRIEIDRDPCTYNTLEVSSDPGFHYSMVKHFGEKQTCKVIKRKITPASDKYTLYYEPFPRIYIPFSPEHCRTNAAFIVEVLDFLDGIKQFFLKCFLPFIFKMAVIFFIFFVLLPALGAYRF